MKKYIVYIKSVFLIAVVVFLYGFGYQRNGVRPIKESVVEFTNGENLFLSHEMVNKLLIQNHGGLKNKSKSLINLQELENVVFSNELVEKAKIFLTIDGVVKTVVTQRTPIARVNTEAAVYYIDKQGLKMPLSSNYSARVLLVSGAIHDADIAPLYALINRIQKNEFLKKMIVGIEKKSEKEYVLRTRVYNQKIVLGEIRDLEKKLKKLEAFYNEVIQNDKVDAYKTINLKYNNQVVCTKN